MHSMAKKIGNICSFLSMVYSSVFRKYRKTKNKSYIFQILIFKFIIIETNSGPKCQKFEDLRDGQTYSGIQLRVETKAGRREMLF